jgi:hypothetical protein
MDQVLRDDAQDDALIADLDSLHDRISSLQRELFELLVEVDRREVWRDDGAHDAAHWVSMRYGISWWKADRWIRAAHALDRLPLLARAFESGAMGVDKVVELARFATPESEASLIAWARGVSAGGIRRRADLECRGSIEEERDAHAARFLSWWTFDEGRRLALEAELPAAEGAVVVRAIERVARFVPPMPDEEQGAAAPARRADALVALCSRSIAVDAEPDRATLVVHAPLRALVSGVGGCEVEGGASIHARTAERLLCNARVQVVVEDEAGDPVGLGRLSREPSGWMMRQLRHRDPECRFPGCGARAFTHAHHIVWWERGGRTDLDNLILVCAFHHRLVHEHGWTVGRSRDGTVRWWRHDGTRYRAGPSLPSPGADLADTG